MAGLIQHDVLVIGGGVVGAALTLDLRQRGFNASLLERGPRPSAFDPERGDARVYAVSPSSARYLSELGVWSGVRTTRAHPYRKMQVWEAQGAGSLSFDAAELPVPNLGWIVEHGLLLERLWSALGDAALPESSVQSLERLERSVVVETEDGQVHTASLLVAADGGQSRVRADAGIPVAGWSYEQLGIVCTVRPERSHQDTAWQRFLETGPLALLPLADGRVSIVWSADESAAERLLEMDDAAFAQALGAASQYCLGEIVAVEKRYRFPLRLQQAQQYVAERVALVGDAAHVIHPLAGQGVNLGLLDAAVLAEEVARAVEQGRGCADSVALARYQRRRRGENLLMQNAMRGFQSLFEQRAMPVRWLRNTGMRWVNQAGPVKGFFARQAMGRTTDLPARANPPAFGARADSR